MSPNEIISYANNHSRFTCTYNRPLLNITWILNETRLHNNNIPNITTTFEGMAGDLTWLNIDVKYNVTFIKCQAFFDNGESLTSATAVLIIQGIII